MDENRVNLVKKANMFLQLFVSMSKAGDQKHLIIKKMREQNPNLAQLTDEEFVDALTTDIIQTFQVTSLEMASLLVEAISADAKPDEKRSSIIC